MESKLNESTVIIAAQRPALFLYVPMNVFVIETLALMLCYALLGWWTVSLLPLHFWFVAQTNDDYQWPRKWWCTITMHFAVGNSGIRKKGVVTFVPNRIGKQSLDHEHLS